MSSFLPLNINTLVLAICAVALFIQQWRQGSSKVSAETIVAYQAQAAINEKTLAAQAIEMNLLNAKVGKLDGIIQEKDKQLSDYKEIFQGRNPQLEEILSKVSTTMTTIVTFMQKVDIRLEGIEIKNGSTMTNNIK